MGSKLCSSYKQHKIKSQNTTESKIQTSVCFGKDGKVMVDHCDYIMRLKHVLNCHSLMNTSDQLVFNDQCRTLLDDWIHVLTIHSHQLQNINQQLSNDILCRINDCQLTARHYSIKQLTLKDYHCAFYQTLLDNIHFYLFHLYDIGLRIVDDELTCISCKYDNIETNYVDVNFGKIRDIIIEKKKTMA
eukprot:21240_1